MTTPLQQLSPLRHTTCAEEAAALAAEQLTHFGIEAQSEYGQALLRLSQCDFSRAFPHLVFTTIPPGRAL